MYANPYKRRLHLPFRQDGQVHSHNVITADFVQRSVREHACIRPASLSSYISCDAVFCPSVTCCGKSSHSFHNKKTGSGGPEDPGRTCLFIAYYFILSALRQTGLLHQAFFTRRDLPVISLGCSLPITSIRVGTMSARTPSSAMV